MEAIRVNGLFITIEGPDGAGKTSVIEELYPRLQLEATRKIVKTREPGGVKIAEKIRKIILDPRNEEMDERTEALLYAAARRQHLIEVVLPALNAGHIVICDRFVDSSLAYQGAGRRIGIPEIARINEFATEGTTPDFTLYLDVDSDTGLRRIQENRAHQYDRLDSEGLEFHQRVRHAYLKLAEENPVRIHKIDARMGLQEVVESSYSAIVESYPAYFKSI
ncbi:dTMP kinase [Enterococcus casseliflavus 14-MB-W-14]|uniref:Thymidylate kinase n=2 Tax=Enterococcus TaxID=1350 RepID=F0EMM3_ENTCA|nr:MULTISPECIES: dTMP kinase [Enterococcus]EGC68753.1 dTMP kinase [Enterococcus casseliflavus ATCC 12755]EPH59639.1 dTMP kinase [Enterococcus casseliflavus 14-MB-W-14]EPH60738.1 dTMP kinase [Enterococcus faecium 13.SD.W.09]EPH90152.1 dTMP kinase [Enterococcus faecalis 06-MB-DW-09]